VLLFLVFEVDWNLDSYFPLQCFAIGEFGVKSRIIGSKEKIMKVNIPELIAGSTPYCIFTCNICKNC
jgi:hypothetical protein